MLHSFLAKCYPALDNGGTTPGLVRAFSMAEIVPPWLPKVVIINLAVSRSPTFGLRSSYAIGPERHVIAEGYMTRKLNFCLKPTLILILTLRPSRRVS